MMTGRLEVVCGPMFAGKTEELIHRVSAAQSLGVRVKLYKPIIDTRYSATDVVSHTGQRISAQPVDVNLPEIEEAEFVAFDEAQFFGPALIVTIEGLLRANRRVLACGLDLDSAGRPFGIMPHLLSIAHNVVKLHATCGRCGGEASRTQRLGSAQEGVWIGGSEIYEPRCGACFRP